jgi:hypothetical protein
MWLPYARDIYKARTLQGAPLQNVSFEIKFNLKGIIHNTKKVYINVDILKLKRIYMIFQQRLGLKKLNVRTQQPAKCRVRDEGPKLKDRGCDKMLRAQGYWIIQM